MLQSLIVAVLVAACAVYAIWSLIPAALRRKLATELLKLELPTAFTGPLRRAAQAASGCGCDGCDHAPDKRSDKPHPSATAPEAAAAPQPITFHRRVPALRIP